MCGCPEAVPRIQCHPRQESNAERVEDYQRDDKTRVASRSPVAQGQSGDCPGTTGGGQGEPNEPHWYSRDCCLRIE